MKCRYQSACIACRSRNTPLSAEFRGLGTVGMNCATTTADEGSGTTWPPDLVIASQFCYQQALTQLGLERSRQVRTKESRLDWHCPLPASWNLQNANAGRVS